MFFYSGAVEILNSSGHAVQSGGGARGVGGEEDGGGAASECSESAQSSSLGPEGKLSSQFPELALILQQIHEIKEEICTIRDDLEGFKVDGYE